MPAFKFIEAQLILYLNKINFKKLPACNGNTYVCTTPVQYEEEKTKRRKKLKMHSETQQEKKSKLNEMK